MGNRAIVKPEGNGPENINNYIFEKARIVKRKGEQE